MRLIPWREHAELVMHVLAHAEATADLPSSLYDAAYVRFAARHLGPATDRPLGEDALALGHLLRSHEALARIQLYAALFDDPDDDPTRELSSTTCLRPHLLPHLAAQGLATALEILRCAVFLERPVAALLPSIEIDRPRLTAAILAVAPAAPGLADRPLLALRALRFRGRLFGDEIWIGEPKRGVSHAHVAWQAAHEATVGEIAKRDRRLSERAVEARASALLEERAKAAGLAADHDRWLAPVRA